MNYTDPPQVSRPLYTEIADGVIETLGREIHARLPPAEADNLWEHLNYLSMSMTVLMQKNDPPDIDEAARMDRVQKVMRMVEQYLTLWYMG